ncbi:hypothetical protein PFISCL1PPCAC_26974, partial [Pristionchus fissidentatus]
NNQSEQTTVLLQPKKEIAPFLPNESKQQWRIPHLRYFIVIIGTLAASIGISCNFAYTFAIVCNVNQTMDTRSVYEESPSHSPIMYFPASITNMNYSAFPAGNILALFLLIALRGRIGVRNQVMVGSAISTLTTALIPFAYDYWPNSTLILKFIQGASVAPTIPLIGHIAANWTPLAEVGFFIAILSSYSQVGLFITMSSAGPLCDAFGWRSIFYFNAACSALVLFLWFFFFHDTPAQHNRLSVKEFHIINPNEKRVVQAKPKVPFREFFKNASVWAVLIAAIGNYNGISPLIVFSSAILKKAVGLTDMQTSYYNAISFFMQLVLKIVSGVLSDRWTSVSESFKTRFFNSISCGLAGLLMIGTAFLPVENKVLCAVSITVTQSFIGFNSAGFNKAAMIVTKQYAYFIVTIIGVIISASTIAEPFLVWAVAPETTWEQWSDFLNLEIAGVRMKLLFQTLFEKTNTPPEILIYRLLSVFKTSLISKKCDDISSVISVIR